MTEYSFDLRLPDSGAVVSGRATVSVTADPRGDTLRLDLRSLSVDGVFGAAPGQALPFTYAGGVLSVPVAGPAVVLVRWHGRPVDGLIVRPNVRGTWSFFGDNWPERARDWIPTVDDPAHKARVSWTVTAAPALRVVANGAFRGTSVGPDGRVTWRYVEAHPIPTYTMVVGASRMTVSRHRPLISGADTIPMEVWAYPEDSAFADSVPFRRVTEVVETLQRIIGPFPYEKLAHVESATRYGGMENSGAIFYAEQMYAGRTMREGVVRHETAHQWFGDAVTERDFHHLWLSEGFASYFDLVAGAALDGDSVLARGMRGNAVSYMRSHDVDRPVLDTAVADLMQLLDANSYQKGAWVLHMLRGLLGDSAFFAGVRAYYRTCRDSAVTSDDFRRTMEAASGRGLDWYFDQWLRQPGYPQLDVTWRYDASAREAVLDVTQVQPSAWGAFRLPVTAIEFMDGPRVLARRTVDVSAAREQTLRIPLDAPPTALRVDPDGALLLTATIRRGPPER